ncbi:hypothetical protein SCALM49S_09856 [Streptomyces californicus]
MARSATWLTSESDGVRTPPVRTTVAAPGRAPPPPAVCRASWNTSATRTELVTTVRSGTSSRCRASA